jgi:ankyrin repeat protein
VPGDLKLAVLSLPKGLAGLDDTYNNAMERIEAQPPGFRKLALNVLTWVIHAQKPLSPQLLLEASTIQPGSHGLDEDFRPDLEDIDSLCAGLVAIDTDSNVVRLVHYTTQEYFERRDWFPRAHFYITEACITYLSFDIFDAIQERHPDLWMFYPFYKYAATSWAHHAQISSYDEALLFRFLQNDAQADMNLRALDIQVNIYGYYGISFISSFAPLVLNTPDNSSDSGVHLTAYFGLTSLMRKLVEKGQSAESRDYAGRTPLWYAAYSGHSETVRALLQDYHVNPNAADHDGCSVLHIAVRIGHVSIVNTLLEIETLNTDIRNDQGYTALTWAARNHNWHLVDILLKDRCVRLTVTEKRSLALSLVEAFSHKADENDPEVTRIRLDLCHRLDMPYPLTRLLPIQQSQTEGTPLPDS